MQSHGRFAFSLYVKGLMKSFIFNIETVFLLFHPHPTLWVRIEPYMMDTHQQWHMKWIKTF